MYMKRMTGMRKWKIESERAMVVGSRKKERSAKRGVRKSGEQEREAETSYTHVTGMHRMKDDR